MPRSPTGSASSPGSATRRRATLGARDHFALALATGELDEDRLFATLDDVDRATAAPFAEWKARRSTPRSRRASAVAVDELRPWHYDDPFFQDPPAEGAVDLDPSSPTPTSKRSPCAPTTASASTCAPVLDHSDLYARDGKSQHAFCIDIDREGDVRVLCNVEPNERWMDTMLHEFGHAIYDRECDRDAAVAPARRRARAHHRGHRDADRAACRATRSGCATSPASTPTTSTRSRRALADARRAALLVFARWVLVMTNFERRLYADPDADLDTLWWDLVERFQLVRRPDGRHAPDWAAKIHLAAAPVYYQNYLYGELVASQLEATLRARAGGIVDRPRRRRAAPSTTSSRPGASLRWDDARRARHRRAAHRRAPRPRSSTRDDVI